MSLFERARKKLTPDARKRFIFLFTLFNTMFCFLFLLLLWNTQLIEDNHQLRNSLQASEVVATEAAIQMDKLEEEIEELLRPKPTSTISPPTVAPTSTNPPPLIRSVTPNTGTIATGAITATLEGSTFASGTTVELIKEGESPIVGANVNLISPTQITCVLDLTGATMGMWSVRVINPDRQSATLPAAFRVCPGPCPCLEGYYRNEPRLP